jgi:hypothetical protein
MTRARWSAVAVACVAASLVVACDVLVLVHHRNGWPHRFPVWLEGSLSLPIWLAIGLLLVFRVPRNPLGAVALTFAVLDGLHLFSGSLATYLIGAGASGWAVNGLIALAIVMQVVVVGSLLIFAQLAPDGRLVSRRWRSVTAATVLALVVAGSANLGSDTDARDAIPAAHAPIRDVSPALLHALYSVAGVLIFVGIGGTVAGLVARWRRGNDLERQQLKLVVFAAVVAVVLALVSQSASNSAGTLMWTVIPTVLPASIAAAILRYGLYDIDRIVSRTVSYAVVSGLVVGAYIGFVALIESVLGFSSSVAVAASTLAVAAGFQPVRRRVQRGIDRRFDRAAYDARRTVDGFAARLRDQVDVDAVTRDLLSTVSSAVVPAQASLWVVQA